MMSLHATAGFAPVEGQSAPLSDRVAHWLHASNTSAKEVARIVGGSEDTGKRLRSGERATSEQIAALARHFGWRFVHFVFEPLCGPAAVAADGDRLSDIEEQIADVKAMLAALGRGDVPLAPLPRPAVGGHGGVARRPRR